MYSLIKFLKVPAKFFKRDVISFVIVRRYDLGAKKESLHYLAIKPTASATVLRQKIWHLLELPDYCDEVIILKSQDDIEVPLTELRRGTCLQQPFILEVWPPGKQYRHSERPAATTLQKNMLTMGNDDEQTTSNIGSLDSAFDEKLQQERLNDYFGNTVHPTLSNETMAFSNINLHNIDNSRPFKMFRKDFPKSNLTCKISSTTIISKLNGRKNRDNYANILSKIQNDLNDLTAKMSKLENRVPT